MKKQTTILHIPAKVTKLKSDQASEPTCKQLFGQRSSMVNSRMTTQIETSTLGETTGQ